MGWVASQAESKNYDPFVDPGGREPGPGRPY
jgi:hypothetical protein